MSRLADRIPPRGTNDPDEILSLFLDWVSASGLVLYPAQEEALLEVMAGKHVILGTPTGSGKSLVREGAGTSLETNHVTLVSHFAAELLRLAPAGGK